MRKIKNGDRVQLLVNVKGGEEGLKNMEIRSGVYSRHHNGFIMVILDGETRELACYRQDVVILPKTDYVPAAEREVISRSVIRVQNEACK